MNNRPFNLVEITVKQANFAIFANFREFAKISCRENVVLYSSFQPVFKFFKSDIYRPSYSPSNLTPTPYLWQNHSSLHVGSNMATQLVLFAFTCDECVKAFKDMSISLAIELPHVSTTVCHPNSSHETYIKFWRGGVTIFQISRLLLVRF